MPSDQSPRYIIEPIQTTHVRSEFDCGHPFLNQYLEQFARQNDHKALAKAFVLVPARERNPVLGYYTLTSSHITFDTLPGQFRKGLPKYPIPVARIGELAVDRQHRGQGLGTDLLLDALCRITRVSEQIAIRAIVVDPIDQKATSFYLHHGFQTLPQRRALILSIQDAKHWCSL